MRCRSTRPSILALLSLALALSAQTTLLFLQRADAFATPNPNDKLLTSKNTNTNNNNNNEKKKEQNAITSELRRAFLASSAAALTYNAITLGPNLGLFLPEGYERVSPIQFIAAIGDPNSNSGTNAADWGLWDSDPGPRGVPLNRYIATTTTTATIANTKKDASTTASTTSLPLPEWLDSTDYLLDENAIIMPPPTFPIPAGQYYVTGGRGYSTGLTIREDGTWRLEDAKHSLYDVTHLPCRAARYVPATTMTEGGGEGGPTSINKADFPVRPGGVMPNVDGATKRDYAVLFVIGQKR